MKINKAILLPVISAVLTATKEITGYSFPNGLEDLIAELVLWTIATLGIFIHPKSHKFDDAENFE
jgi:hypothetical protein